MNEHELLRAFAQQRSPEAFAELVKQNIDLVYAAAHRQVRDGHLAEDVTQAVFILLAKKAGTVKGPVAGWLIKATYYCCRDARRLARRRAYHERQAMAMRPDVQGEHREDETTVKLPLDEALLRLRAKDRDAITLRYLQGKSLRETGELLGIGEEAARKRVDRAVERLRAAVMPMDAESPASAMNAFLAAHAAVAAPAGLASTITTAAGAAVKGSLAGTIAATGAKAFWWAQVKWPVGIAAAAIVLGGTVGASVILRRGAMPAAPSITMISAPLPVPAIAPTSAANPDEDESHIPGQMQLMRWDVLLDASEIPSLQKIAAPLVSSSMLYKAYRCKGTDLRRAIRNAINAGTLVRSSDNMQIANDSMDPGHHALQFFNPPYFQHMDSPATRIMLLGGSTLQNDSFIRSQDNHLHLNIAHPDFHIGIAELSGDMTWFNQLAQVMYQGDLAPGEALAFMGEFQLPPVASGRRFVHVIAWESFQAANEQMDVAPEERDARWWCENGPSQLRHWADAARVWVAQVPERPVMPANAEIKLEDGKVLHLEALCRPSKWPNCWWDAQGNPVKSQNKIITFQGDAPEGLFAYVTVSGGAPDEHHRRNPSYHFAESGPYQEIGCEAIEEGDGSINVGVAVGPWTKAATLELNKPQAINGVRYQIRKPMSFGDDQFLVHFSRSGMLENDDLLLPTAADGSVASTSAEPTILFHHNVEQQVKNEQPNFHNMALSKVIRYDLMQRKRVWVSFANVQTEPRITPPSFASPEDAHNADLLAERRALELVGRTLAEKRRDWANIAPDRKGVFGTLRMLVDAVHSGDEKAVRSLLTAQSPEAKQLLEPAAHFVVTTDSLRRTVNEKLGRELTDDERLHLGSYAFLVNDLEQELFVFPWSGDKESHSPGDHYILRRNDAGAYALAIDDLLKMPDPGKYLGVQTALAEQVRAEVQARKTLTYAEFQTLLKAASTPQKESSPK